MTTTSSAANDQKDQKVAVVTGGASGIGLAAARHLASAGYSVAILDVDAVQGPAVAASLAAEFPSASSSAAASVSFVRCDVTSWAEQRDAFASAYAAHGRRRIDVVVANAGVSEQGAPNLAAVMEKDGDEPEEPVLRVLNINLVGVIYCASHTDT